MKLKEYAEHIAQLAMTFPEAEVIYAIDDEGNDYKTVCHFPSMVHKKYNKANLFYGEVEGYNEEKHERGIEPCLVVN